MFFFIENAPCPPSNSFHPRSSVRVERMRAVLADRLVAVACDILLKNHVFVKKVVLKLVLVESNMDMAMSDPEMVTMRGVCLIISEGNRVGILNNHFDSSHPDSIVPRARRIRGLYWEVVFSLYGFIGEGFDFFLNVRLMMRNL